VEIQAEHPEKDMPRLTLADTLASMRNACSEKQIVTPSKIGILHNRYNLSSLLEFFKPSSPCQPDNSIESIVGEDDELLKPAYLNWAEDGPHLLIAGPSHSGRTCLLQTIALSAAAKYSPDQLNIILVDGTNTSLRRLAPLPHVLERVTDESGLSRNIANLFSELAFRRVWMQNHAPASEFDAEPDCPFPRILLLMDDYDLTRNALGLNEEILARLGKHIRQDSDLGFHIILSSITNNISNNADPLILQMKLMRVGISLGDTETLEILGGRVSSAMRSEELPEGRGYRVSRSGARLIQFAFPDPAAYNAVLESWKDWNGRAQWMHPASVEEVTAVEQDSAPDHSGSGNIDSSINSSTYINLEEATQRYIQLRRLEQEKKGTAK